MAAAVLYLIGEKLTQLHTREAPIRCWIQGIGVVLCPLLDNKSISNYRPALKHYTIRFNERAVDLRQSRL